MLGRLRTYCRCYVEERQHLPVPGKQTPLHVHVDLPRYIILLYYRPLYTCHPTWKTLGTLSVVASAYPSGPIALITSVTSIILVQFFDRKCRFEVVSVLFHRKFYFKIAETRDTPFLFKSKHKIKKEI